MKAGSRPILCDPELIEVRDAHFRRLEALFAGEQRERPFLLRGIVGAASSDPYRQPERWLDETLVTLADQAQQARSTDVFRPLCLEWRGPLPGVGRIVVLGPSMPHFERPHESSG